MALEITVDRINRLEPNGKSKTRGFVDLCINSCLKISGFSVVEGNNGDLFVSMPQHKGKDKTGNDKYYNDVYFQDKADYEKVQSVVLAKWNEK